MKNSQKGFVVPLLIVIAALVIGGGVYYYYSKSKKDIKPDIIQQQDVNNQDKGDTVSLKTTGNSFAGETVNPIISSTVFEIGKSFTISGNSSSGNSLASLYTSDKILQKSLVTARAYNFYSDACIRAGTVNCPFKGEQMVRIDLGIAESIGASWNDKAIYLTNKTYKTQIYRGYTIELLSIDSQKKEAIIVIRKN